MADVLPIFPYLNQTAVFDPDELQAMSTALDEVCEALGIRDNSVTKEVIAVRIVDLARQGERSPTKIRDRILAEANGEPKWT